MLCTHILLLGVFARETIIIPFHQHMYTARNSNKNIPPQKMIVNICLPMGSYCVFILCPLRYYSTRSRPTIHLCFLPNPLHGSNIFHTLTKKRTKINVYFKTTPNSIEINNSVDWKNEWKPNKLCVLAQWMYGKSIADIICVITFNNWTQ